MTNVDTSDEFDSDDLKALGLTEFDPADYLTSRTAIATYMSEIAASGDAALFQTAMNDVVRAVGLGALANDAKLSSMVGDKPLRDGATSHLQTIMALLDAMGMQFAIIPKADSTSAAPAL